MDKLDITKKAVQFIVSAGVGKIAHDVIANNTADPENVYQKVTVYAGAAVVAMMAKDASKRYTSTKIDELAATWKRVNAKIEEAQQEK